jgi:predicted small metal-binding protein
MPERRLRDKKSLVSQGGWLRIGSVTNQGDSMKNLACNEVIPGCPFTVRAETEEELFKQVATHANHSHGVKEVTPELLSKVKSAIREEKPGE